ncbi:MAG: hypothetical protein MK207_08770 [Saprospiraceae bacterium]|nr:hypothetical protein [Saprospiraceae bacterium]
MKNLLTTLFLVIGITNFITAQTEKTITKSFAVNQSQMAFVMLPGDVTVNEWNENYIRLTTNVTVENMSENIVKQLVIVGRYNIEVKEDKYGKMIVVKMPDIAHFVTVKGVALVESYTFEINTPVGYKVVIKDDLNPNAPHNSTLQEAI